MRDLYNGRHLFRFLRLKMSNIQLRYLLWLSSLHAKQIREHHYNQSTVKPTH